VLAALDATTRDLAALPAPPIPPQVADRIESALAAEVAWSAAAQAAPQGPQALPPAQVPQVPPLAQVPHIGIRRRRTAAWASAAVLTTAAALVGIIALAGAQRETAGIPQARDSLGAATGVGPTTPQALTSDDLTGMLGQALAHHDMGPLSEPGRLRGCLAANGVPDTADPLGAMEVDTDGRRGVMLVFPSGRIAQFRVLVVGEDCAPGTPALLTDQLIGRR
jgi:hypothetical protein